MNPPITTPSPRSSHHLSPCLFSTATLPQSWMPSWPLTPPSPPSLASHRHHAAFLAVVSTSSILLVVLALFLLLFYLYRSLHYACDRTLPSTPPPLPPSVDSPSATSATASFDPSYSLGHNASANIFCGLLFYLYCSLCQARSRDRTLPLDPPTTSTLCRFSFRDLHFATASFDLSRSLSRGASADVFRGLLPDGKSVAVKCLDLPSSPSPSPSSSPPFSSSNHEFRLQSALNDFVRRIFFHMADGALEKNKHVVDGGIKKK